jgi:hypothetical protein
MADHWEWEDEKAYTKDPNIYQFNFESFNISSENQYGPNILSSKGTGGGYYLETPTDCAAEGGRWISHWKDPRNQEAGTETSEWKRIFGDNHVYAHRLYNEDPGKCVLRKGNMPKFLEASNIQSQKDCEKKGYVWDDSIFSHYPCYYQIPTNQQSQCADGDRACRFEDGFRDTTETVGEVVDAVAALPGEAFDLIEWIMRNKILSLIIAGTGYYVFTNYIPSQLEGVLPRLPKITTI